MTIQPRTQEEIYESLKSRLSTIPELTRWSEGSPNYVLVHDGYANALQRVETALLATQLSGWVDYAGGPVTESELENIGVDTDKVDVDALNDLLKDSDLDALAANNSITRDPGDKATVDVTFTVDNDAVTVDENTEVATQPTSDGDYLSFFTDEDAIPADGDNTVTVTATAESVGQEYNIGADTLTYLPSPPLNVTDVTNDSSATGGTDRETNEELRPRVRGALAEKSGGGTLEGVKGGIVSSVDGVTDNDIEIDQFFDPSTSNGDRQDSNYFDVIVSGGNDSDLNDAIDRLQPVSVKGYLVRPEIYTVSVTSDVEGSNIDTSATETAVSDLIDALTINETLYKDQIIQEILNADDNITNIQSLTITIVDDTYTYSSGTDIYELDKGDSMKEDGITEVAGTLNSSSTTFTEGADYEEEDVNSDGDIDGIDWGIGGDSPDDSTDFFVDYEIEEDIPIAKRENTAAGTITVNVV